MQFERKKGAARRSATLIFRLTHKRKHRLQTGPANSFASPSLLGKPLGGLHYCRRCSPREPLSIMQTKFELGPNSERMRTQRVVVERIRNLSVDRVGKLVLQGRYLKRGICRSL